MAQQRDAEQRLRGDARVLDDAARQRRLRKQLEQLEQDNFQEDPHAAITFHKNRPKLEDPNEQAASSQSAKKKRKLRGERSKQRFAKRLGDLLAEEELRKSEPPNYFSARAPPSKLPARHFCAVCGFFSNYTCMQCGARYCSLKCLDHHKNTRCQKWTA